jgi:indole-3-glycerol phosphate synthase
MTTDTLARICADKRDLIARRKAMRPLSVVEAAAKAASPPRGFARALAAAVAAGRTGLIAEIKKASPSRGVIRADFDSATLARAYRDGGATCLSVLTDEAYFQGRDEDLVAARAAVELPILRKDFTLDPYQVAEARALGADCVLLILGALDDAEAAALESAAAAHGMDALIEVHDVAEMERALRLHSRLIGINNRNLKTLRVDLATTEQLARLAPADRLLVAESGIFETTDLARMARAGARSALVGESLMRQADVAAATRALLGQPAHLAHRA